ncbi:MAG TPA: hypothetical protein VF446_16775 [Trinickia sp.]
MSVLSRWMAGSRWRSVRHPSSTEFDRVLRLSNLATGWDAGALAIF